ncbi:RNB-domain-containing protein, partial [Fragilariopsis cylindrus CCMP1102]
MTILEHAKILATRCEEDYNRRNDPAKKLKGHSLDSVTGGVEEYWTEDIIQEGLRNRTLVRGKLTVTKDNIKEAIVSSGGGSDNSSSYFINQTKGYFNRALHQDIVIVMPLPRQEWTSPVGRRRLVHVQPDDNDVTDNDDETSAPPIPSGRVVAIVSESRRQFVATMVDTPMNDESSCLVLPMDMRIPKIRIRTNGWRRFVGQRLLVQVERWEVGSNYPSGFCVEILGPIAHIETEITCLLKENQIDLDPFSAAAQACLPLEGNDWKIPSQEISQRKDLRSTHRIFSVDPNGCQDIDDTFHARVLPNGDIEVGVHIADVTYFLPHDSPLDKEAQRRATTFYLVDRRFDMLPSVLSGNLCSLHGNMERLAVSTIWTMSSDFKVVKDFWYGRTVIRNCQAMTYDQAHNILHNLPPDDPSKPHPPPLTAGYPVTRSNNESLKGDLSLLTKLARKLRKDREDIGGAVDLSSGDQGNELKFSLDGNHQPVKVTPKKQLEIHQTVAELMIMANSWVARTIFETFPNSALLRIHQSVDESRFEDLKEILDAGKITFDGSSNMKLADSLKKAERSSKSNSAVNSLFQSLATRAMSEAQYVSTGDVGGENNLSHYGLGLGKYTHFTSPIRRYADVVVHRQLL